MKYQIVVIDSYKMNADFVELHGMEEKLDALFTVTKYELWP